MKKIINHVTYNTATATEVACYRNGIATDAYYIEARLYYSRRVGWFLYNEGGALSCYGERVEEPSGIHYYASGFCITPIDDEEMARDFCAEYGSYDDYVTYFGEPEEA